MMNPGPILIIEDEPKVADFIKKGLEEQGFDAEIAYDGLIGKSMVLMKSYSLIILDLNLPLLNGFQLCKIIRTNNPQIPILILTALSGIDEKIKGFESGADDYLLKPFEVRELIVRIKALLKRSSLSEQYHSVVKIADLEIDKDTKRISRAGKSIVLTLSWLNMYGVLILTPVQM
jgi:two-component system, OmpR family, copper resistance phosphate regulon response regulator CusR